MKTNELKKVLKPLIKQCIKECIFEEGVLSGIITEVAKGMASQHVVVEGLTVKNNTSDPEELQRKADDMERKRQEKIRKLNESMKVHTNNVDVFEGTSPIAAEGAQHSPLAGIASGDAGVDISSIVNIAGGKWKHLI